LPQVFSAHDDGDDAGSLAQAAAAVEEAVVVVAAVVDGEVETATGKSLMKREGRKEEDSVGILFHSAIFPLLLPRSAGRGYSPRRRSEEEEEEEEVLRTTYIRRLTSSIIRSIML
jgi:hypothetical protein